MIMSPPLARATNDRPAMMFQPSTIIIIIASYVALQLEYRLLYTASLSLQSRHCLNRRSLCSADLAVRWALSLML